MRASLVMSTLASGALACGDGGNGPAEQDSRCVPLVTASEVPSLDIAGVRANAAAGASSITITGSFPRTLAGRASAFGRDEFPALAVIDAFTTDASGRPVSELFVFLVGRASVRTVPLVPVTLAELRDRSFVPTGALAVYAEDYDVQAGDYTRWLLGQAGTLSITEVLPGEIGRLRLSLSVRGEWQDANARSLGCGEIQQATIDAPLVRGAGGADALTDTLTAALTGSRQETLGTQTIDAFQALTPDDTRLLIVGVVPRDSTRELWLSLEGVPVNPDSIPLGELTLAGALAGRDTGSFGLLRLNTPGSPTPITQEIWRSTTGYVRLTNVVQAGPLALCGWASGRYSFSATGVNTSTAASLGTLTATGAFETRFTVLAPVDSFVGLPARTLARVISLASPSSAKQRSCFL